MLTHQPSQSRAHLAITINRALHRRAALRSRLPITSTGLRITTANLLVTLASISPGQLRWRPRGPEHRMGPADHLKGFRIHQPNRHLGRRCRRRARQSRRP